MKYAGKRDTHLHLRVPSELKKALQNDAKAEGYRSLSHFVISKLVAYAKKPKHTTVKEKGELAWYEL